MHRFRPPSASALAAASAAVLLTAGGTATAAKLITGRDIKNGSITSKDLSRATKTALKGRTGAHGPAGPQGPQGPQGPAGPSALSGVTEVRGSMLVAAGDVDGGSVSCPAGQRAISGGFFTDGAEAEVFLSVASPDRTGWDVALDNIDASISATLEGYAYCAGAGQAVAARRRPERLAPLDGRAARRVERRERRR